MPTMLTPEQIERFRSGKGSPYLAPNEVLSLLPWLNQNGLFVQSMEAVEVNKFTRIDVSILGLDGEEDWESHFDVQRMNGLVHQKVQSAVDEGGEFEFQIWIDYGSEYDVERAALQRRGSS